METNTSILLTMESLDLPRDLYWDLKQETPSPRSVVPSELFALNETTTSITDWIYDDNFANGITLIGDVEGKDQTDSDPAELLSDEDFVVEFLDLKNGECLLDQKAHYIEYPANQYQTHIDVVSQPIIPTTKIEVTAPTTPAPSVVVLPQQCEDSSVIFQQLTPPQSPPQFDAYQHQQQQPLVKAEQKVLPYASDATNSSTSAAANNFQFNNWTAGSEIDRESQLVDDIVKLRAQELQWQQINDDCESQASSSLDCSSNNSSIDEEWLPEQNSSAQSSPAHSAVEELSQHQDGDFDLETDVHIKTPKKRTRAYGRGVEDRKIRKKEQNKNAATRYRQKKKLEMENVLGEEQILAQENETLRRTLADRRHELRYLRQLIREFYQGRKH
ncbi:uncharacterized protein crc isoform X1 [Drosophila tropicalis]|uniref:uncharacterized protein crc isoform X1 n=1 Tax=Drosophila tropicalis TaxID=46794 RepID=UPI0035AC2710